MSRRQMAYTRLGGDRGSFVFGDRHDRDLIQGCDGKASSKVFSVQRQTGLVWVRKSIPVGLLSSQGSMSPLYGKVTFYSIAQPHGFVLRTYTLTSHRRPLDITTDHSTHVTEAKNPIVRYLHTPPPAVVTYRIARLGLRDSKYHTYHLPCKISRAQAGSGSGL